MMYKSRFLQKKFSLRTFTFYLLPFTFYLLSFTFYLITSCEEQGPTIDLNPPPPADTTLRDTSYIDLNIQSVQKRNVLLEEFTGVECTNCPDGQEKIKEMLMNNPERIFSVSIHSGYYANPIPGLSKEDYKTIEGTNIENMLGKATGWPSASVSRILFDGENARILTKPKWQSYCDSLIKLNSPINLYCTSIYDETTREARILVKIHYSETMLDSNNLSIMITESNIIDAQMKDTGVDTFYVHNHVLRGMITSSNGILLSVTKDKGRVILKEFKTTLKSNWNAKNCSVVGFVHKTGSLMDIIQVNEINVVP